MSKSFHRMPLWAHDCALNYKFLMVIAASNTASFLTILSLQHANMKRD